MVLKTWYGDCLHTRSYNTLVVWDNRTHCTIFETLDSTILLLWCLHSVANTGEGETKAPCWVGPAATELFYRTRILALRSVVDIAGSDLNNAAAQAASLGIQSVRIIKQLLGHWRHCLTGHGCVLLETYCHSVTVPYAGDPFPPLGVHPRFGNCTVFFCVFFIWGEELYSAKPTRCQR